MHLTLCQWAVVIVLFPLAGFVLQTFLGARLPRKGDWLPTFCIFVPWAISLWMFFGMLASPAGYAEPELWSPDWGKGWLLSGTAFQIDIGVRVDNLTVVMLLVVTTVSFLVHLYSWGYMHAEVRYNHFFAYLGLFTFSMLGLCVVDNLLLLFVFWELVGVCSYFLIGFYFEKKSAQNAAIKAFLTTRVGDLGIFLSILIIASTVGSLDFPRIFESVRQGEAGPWTAGLLTVTGLCLFLGAVGKSAQFPLHVWLPDAMEGPTPVSALIHAATMVAAGVYLVGRLFPVLAGFGYFEGDFFQSDVLLVVAVVGAITAFFAATIAFVQTDIKKVLAYSTISQLGYMFIGLGVGSVSAGLFHLTTHAFFKALLFLGSGSVIHAVHSNELAHMGGLRKKLPWTHATFLAGTLAISGLPLLSGFYSKEAILGQAYGFLALRAEEGHGGLLTILPFALGVLTAGMTAFYMFRLYFGIFSGKPRDEPAHAGAHESPWTMTVPLVTLATLAVVSGGCFFLGDSHLWFEHRVNAAALVPLGVTGTPEVLEHVRHLVHEGHSWVLAASVGLFVAGVGLASLFYLPIGPFWGRDWVGKGSPLAVIQRFLVNLWYIDRFYNWLFLGLVHGLRRACGWFDRWIVDGFVNFWGRVCQFATAITGAVDHDGVDGAVRALGATILGWGRQARRLQPGLLQVYLYSSLLTLGVVVIGSLTWVLW